MSETISDAWLSTCGPDGLACLFCSKYILRLSAAHLLSLAGVTLASHRCLSLSVLQRAFAFALSFGSFHAHQRAGGRWERECSIQGCTGVRTIKGEMTGLKRHEHYLLSQALCTSEQLAVHSQLGSASRLMLELTTGSQKGNLSLARAKTVKCLCVSSARSPVAASLCRHGGGGKRTDNKQLKAPCVTCHDSGAENVGLTVSTRGCLLLF